MNNSSYNNYKFPVVEKVIKKEVLKTKLPMAIPEEEDTKEKN